MKKTKVLALIALCVAAVLLLCSCDATQRGNRVVGGKDVQTFTYAYVYCGGTKVVEGYITQWRDYDNSDVVQLLIDGKYYLTHYSCVVMIADPSHGTLSYSYAPGQDYGE